MKSRHLCNASKDITKQIYDTFIYSCEININADYFEI